MTNSVLEQVAMDIEITMNREYSTEKDLAKAAVQALIDADWPDEVNTLSYQDIAVNFEKQGKQMLKQILEEK